MRSIAKIFNLNDPGWGRGGSQNAGQNSGQSGGQPAGGSSGNGAAPDGPPNNSQPPRRPRPYQGNRNNAPDFEDVWRDFNNRLGSILGGNKRRSGGNGQGGRNNGNGQGGRQAPAKGSPRLLAIGALVLVLFWLGSSFMIVQEGQVAVVTRFGKYTKTLPPGLQWRLPWPVESHQTVNIAQLRTFEVGFRGTARNKVLPESLMLTTDENIVDVQFVVQYRLNSEGAPD